MIGHKLLQPISTVHLRRIEKSAMAASIPDRRLIESLTLNYSDAVVDSLEDLTDSFLITDPSISGHPIVFASRGFLAMTGYSREEVVGRNARIFQGPATDRRSVMEIREAIMGERTVQIGLLNYRKDGTPYWILFHLCPVFFDHDGDGFSNGNRYVPHFLAVQVPIADKRRSCPGRTAGLALSCRDEVKDERLGCPCRVSLFDSFEGDTNARGLEAEESREASDGEKQKATNAAKTILSILSYYRKHNERSVRGKRSSSKTIAPLSSSLNVSLGRIKQSFVLTDPYLPDMPIVYASDTFLNLTGYSRNEVLGRNCRFLSGPGTDVEVLHLIKDSIREEQPCTVCLLNYRKGGNSFWNHLHISPVRNAGGKVAYYVGVQIDESSKDEANNLSPEMRQLSVVGAVKVAVRSLSAFPSTSSRSRPSS